MTTTTNARARNRTMQMLMATLALLAGGLTDLSASQANQRAVAQSFVEDFDRLDGKRWYVSDGWSNGDHQNCIWSRQQVKVSNGTLKLGFVRQDRKDRKFVCSEIQTNQRFGFGVYEARLKAVAGPGLNTGFFNYIGPVHKQPHDEIDFEVLGKDPSKVQLNQYVDGKGVGDAKLVDVPGGAEQAFNDYAFVWEERRIAWYINGDLVHRRPTPPSCRAMPRKSI